MLYHLQIQLTVLIALLLRIQYNFVQPAYLILHLLEVCSKLRYVDYASYIIYSYICVNNKNISASEIAQDISSTLEGSADDNFTLLVVRFLG